MPELPLPDLRIGREQRLPPPLALVGGSHDVRGDTVVRYHLPLLVRGERIEPVLVHGSDLVQKDERFVGGPVRGGLRASASRSARRRKTAAVGGGGSGDALLFFPRSGRQSLDNV